MIPFDVDTIISGLVEFAESNGVDSTSVALLLAATPLTALTIRGVFATMVARSPPASTALCVPRLVMIKRAVIVEPTAPATLRLNCSPNLCERDAMTERVRLVQ